MNAIVIFMKAPVPGTVKTRLTPWLSPEEAAALYRALVKDTAALAGRVPDAVTCIAYTPADARPALAELLDTESLQWFPQADGDLGNRLKAAFEKAWDTGMDKTIIIGSDCPLLPPEYIEKAFTLLDHDDVVLGPAEDGGYYLIGLSRSDRVTAGAPPLFNDIAWSTEKVFEQTVHAARHSGLSLSTLNTLSDVDQKEDLARLASEIKALRAQGDHISGLSTEQVLSSLPHKP